MPAHPVHVSSILTNPVHASCILTDPVHAYITPFFIFDRSYC